ncbi:rna-directed dna polymerase from mobile element jockey-like [Willisornis vidua]|uniref:Rna-directed dna polymerase from mobile element jockey-like n=1 Tax=Willisornis vidua TaxID=1566151 RepID=A0ABQ9DUU7_9PASS|nr:rna-directed dna polymerase from mobile element jockey-like [Willisornis vidua]
MNQKTKVNKRKVRDVNEFKAKITFTGSILAHVLFNIFISDFDAELEGILSKTADNTKLGGAVDSLKGRKALQRDLDKPEDWAITNCVKFSKGKGQILHVGWGNPGCTYRLGNDMLESSVTERDLGILDNDLVNKDLERALPTLAAIMLMAKKVNAG